MDRNTDNNSSPRTHLSASAALYTGVLSLVPAGAKFKAGAETTRRRIENMRRRGEKRYEYPHLCPDASVSESEICGIRTYILQREKREDRVIVYVHGGGFVQEMLPMHWFFLDDIAAMTGATVYIPIYPLVPHPLDYVICIYYDEYNYIFESSEFDDRVIKISLYDREEILRQSVWFTKKDTERMAKEGYRKTKAVLDFVFSKGMDDAKKIYGQIKALNDLNPKREIRLTGDVAMGKLNKFLKTLTKRKIID